VSFVDTTPELWDQLIAINLRGPLNMSHVVLKGMVARGHGRIVNIASDAGRVGSSLEAVYTACKGGIIAFTKTVAREVARKGITLNSVCPGPTETPLLAAAAGEGERGDRMRAALVNAIPMKRVGQPEDIPGAVCFLASDDAAFITGQTISVSGGLTMHG
jgi:2-hydroxycyclohexanecarboxyl-CoA dehydrogenase